MPFSLRSDEELIAEAKRALKALGVEVVIDSTSNSLRQCAEKKHGRNSSRAQDRAAILTSRAAIDKASSDACWHSAALVSLAVQGQRQHLYYLLPRNRPHVDGGAAAVAWWRRITADPRWRTGTIDCCACRRRVPTTSDQRGPCQQCLASICTACIKRAGHLFKCPECTAWYLPGTRTTWGVPWDMPRPAPTRTTPPSHPSALPQRVAAAVGPDGWLRRPPRHQRMHPVDVLVDGVLAALDGQMGVYASTGKVRPTPDDAAIFTRLPLSDRFKEEGAVLEGARRRLKQTVEKFMREARHTLFQEARLEVHRKAATVHPVADQPTIETSVFMVRVREQSAAAGSSSNAPSSPEEHTWQLVQLAPDAWLWPDEPMEATRVRKVAYLEPERVEVPLAVRRVLRDAHARLGGTACGAKQVMVLCPGGPDATLLALKIDRQGRELVFGGPVASIRPTASTVCSFLRQARVPGAALYALCWDSEAIERAGLDPEGPDAVWLELRLWRLEGLAWRQRQQRREVEEEAATRWRAMRWERRGGAGRRGRRRREPAVVFALGAWGEQRRAVSHDEAVWVQERAVMLGLGTAGG